MSSTMPRPWLKTDRIFPRVLFGLLDTVWSYGIDIDLVFASFSVCFFLVRHSVLVEPGLCHATEKADGMSHPGTVLELFL